MHILQGKPKFNICEFYTVSWTDFRNSEEINDVFQSLELTTWIVNIEITYKYF